MKRKITALLLSAVLLLSLCGAPAVLADEAEAGAIQPDPVGSVSFANLDQRLRENNFNLLALEETIASIQSIDYDRMEDTLRDNLNNIAQAQWQFISMGSMVDNMAGGLGMPGLGTAMTSASVQSMTQAYDSLRDTFDDLRDGKLQADNADVVRQLRSAQDQIVMASQALYIALIGMEDSLVTVDRGLATLDRTIQEMELRHELGQISALTLQDVTANRTALRSSRQTLVANIENYKMQLELMIGGELTGTIDLGALPEVTADQVAEMDLEADLEKAIAASYELYAAKKTLEDAEEDYKDAKKQYGYSSTRYEAVMAEHTWQASQYTYSATCQNFEMKFRTLYQKVTDGVQVLAAARAALETKKADHAAAALKYDQGAISRNALLTAQDEVAAAQDTVTTAALDLFTAYNNYRWAVDHGIIS